MQTHFIESRQALDEFLHSIDGDWIDGERLLAVDTEFFRETTYYPQLGLVQLATREHVACVDPLAFDAREMLAQLLLDDSITKLFHSCSQDMEVLLHYLGQLPCPVIDTQIATALLGNKDQISYADMVALHMNIDLEKSQTRTNWLKRPLSRKQLQYAAEDVMYLIPVYELLTDALEKKGRMSWLQHDCERLCSSAQRYTPDIETCWQRVKGTRKLSGVQLAIVDALARWREHKAIELDVARRLLISDDLIVHAAAQQPEDAETLRDCGRIHDSITPNDLQAMLSVIQSARSSHSSSWPQHIRYGMDNEAKKLLRSSMQSLETKARELGIAQATLGSRKELEKMINGQRQLNLLSDWRYHCIGKDLLQQLEQG